MKDELHFQAIKQQIHDVICKIPPSDPLQSTKEFRDGEECFKLKVLAEIKKMFK